jgi:hypothetical protein
MHTIENFLSWRFMNWSFYCALIQKEQIAEIVGTREF